MTLSCSLRCPMDEQKCFDDRWFDHTLVFAIVKIECVG